MANADTDKLSDQSTSEANETKNAAPETTDPSVTGTSSQEAAVIASRKNVLSNGKEKKPQPIFRIKSESGTFELPKLPFEFADLEFSEFVFKQLSNACSRTDGLDNALFKSMFSIMMSQKITDPFDLMIINQMTGFNDLVMKYIGLLANADNEIEIEIYERTLNKLARTFAALLQQYRSGGGQKVTVQNVSVSEGGQAIVGNVNQQMLDGAKAKAATTPAAIVDAHSTPMPTIEHTEQPVTVPAERRVSQ